MNAASETLERIVALWPQINLNQRSPIEIPDVTRDDFAVLLSNLGMNLGVEVGTEYGIYAETLLQANPALILHCVDPYLAYGGYREHVSQDKLDAICEQAMQRLSPYPGASMLREPSVTAAMNFNDSSLDFVYIDANHSLPYVIADLHAWVPKVRKGGIVAGHDFIRRKNSLRYQCHVVEAVHAWTQCYMIDKWFIVGHRSEGKRDTVRSWFWIKS